MGASTFVDREIDLAQASETAFPFVFLYFSCHFPRMCGIVTGSVWMSRLSIFELSARTYCELLFPPGGITLTTRRRSCLRTSPPAYHVHEHLISIHPPDRSHRTRHSRQGKFDCILCCRGWRFGCTAVLVIFLALFCRLRAPVNARARYLSRCFVWYVLTVRLWRFSFFFSLTDIVQL